jgi:hypothetical protein
MSSRYSTLPRLPGEGYFDYPIDNVLDAMMYYTPDRSLIVDESAFYAEKAKKALQRVELELKKLPRLVKFKKSPKMRDPGSLGAFWKRLQKNIQSDCVRHLQPTHRKLNKDSERVINSILTKKKLNRDDAPFVVKQANGQFVIAGMHFI